MAKKKNKIQETTIENYYDLKVDKIDELVAALTDETYQPEKELSMNISDCTGIDDPANTKRNGKQKQFDPYRNDLLGRIPTWLKALFIKFWFAGVVCWFIMAGIGLTDFDAMVITGAVLGIFVDVLVNPLFRYMETDRKEYDVYTMFPFPFKAFWTFFANIVYYVIIVLIVGLFGYNGLNSVINIFKGTESVYYVGVEPLLFGVFAVAVDMVFIGIKDLVVFLVKKARRKENTANV